MDLCASTPSNKLDRFVFRYRDPLVETVDVLVGQLNQYTLNYTLPLLPEFAPQLLFRIEIVGIQVIPIALDWLRQMRNTDLVRLMTDALWDHQDLLSQGLICLPFYLAFFFVRGIS